MVQAADLVLIVGVRILRLPSLNLGVPLGLSRLLCKWHAGPKCPFRSQLLHFAPLTGHDPLVCVKYPHCRHGSHLMSCTTAAVAPAWISLNCEAPRYSLRYLLITSSTVGSSLMRRCCSHLLFITTIILLRCIRSRNSAKSHCVANVRRSPS